MAVIQETSNGLSRQDSIPMWVMQHLSLTESYLQIRKKLLSTGLLEKHLPPEPN